MIFTTVQEEVVKWLVNLRLNNNTNLLILFQLIYSLQSTVYSLQSTLGSSCLGSNKLKIRILLVFVTKKRVPKIKMLKFHLKREMSASQFTPVPFKHSSLQKDFVLINETCGFYLRAITGPVISAQFRRVVRNFAERNSSWKQKKKIIQIYPVYIRKTEYFPK